MNIFKINSQGLINDSQNTEDLFSRSILDEERVFDLQRFENGKVKFTQDSSKKITLEAANSLTGVLTAYTLGRAGETHSDTLNWTAFKSNVQSDASLGTNVYIAPIIGVSGSDAAFATATYKFSIYSDTGVSGYRIAVAHSSSSVAQLGIAGSTSWLTESSYQAFYFSDNTINNAGVNLSSTGIYATYSPVFGTGTFKAALFNIGGSTSSLAKIGSSDVTVDFYDARQSTGSYTYIHPSTNTNSIDFVNPQSATFELAAGTTYNFNLNRTAVTLNANKASNSDSALFILNTVATGDSAIQSFTGIAATSDVWVSFGIAGSGTSGSQVFLAGTNYGSDVYLNQAGASGTITFGATDTTTIGKDVNFIEFAKGNFTPKNVASGTMYALTDNASGTFALTASKTYYFDFDGIAGTRAPIAFSTTAAASITAVANSTNITLAGGLKALTSDASTIAAYVYTLSDTASATLGQFTFIDAKNSSNSVVQFATNNVTDVTLNGVFADVFSETSGKGLYGVKFTLSDTTFAKLGAISVSDTSNTAVSQVIFGATSDTVTLNGVMTVTSDAGITYTMSSSALVSIGDVGITFSDTGADGATFKFGTGATDITLSGTLAVADGTTDMTKVLSGYTFQLSDTGFAQLGLVAVSDTGGNSSATKISLSAADSSDVTLSGGGADIYFGTGTDTSYKAYTFTLSDTGTYSINGKNFIATANGTTSNTVIFTDVKLTYDTTHSDTAGTFAVVSSEISAYKVGSNITVGSETIAASSAKLYGNVYVGATSGAVTYSPVAGSDVAVISGNGFQISGVSDSKLVGVQSYTFKTDSTGVFFVKDGGSDLTITNAAGSNPLRFAEISDGTATKLELTGTNAMSLTGNLVVATDTANTSMVYTLNGASVSDTSSITIDGIKFAGYASDTVTNNSDKQYTLVTTSSDNTLAITGAVTSETKLTWNSKAAGILGVGGISIGIASNTALTSPVNITFTSDTTLASGTATQSLTIGSNGLLDIKDGGSTDVYKVLINADDGKITEIDNISSGAILTSVGGATMVKTDSSGTFVFKTSSLIGTSDTKYQAFNITGDTDVTFVLDTTGTVQEIQDLDAGAVVAVTDTLVSTSTSVVDKVNYWTKTISPTFSRDSATGKWGAAAAMGYIVNMSSTSVYSLLGIDSDAKMAHPTAEFGTETGIASGMGLVTITGSATSKLPLTFQNAAGGTYAVTVSDGTVTSLFTGFVKTEGNVGVQSTYEDGKYTLSLVGVSDSGVPGSFTTKAAIADGTASLTLSDTAAMNVYEGFTVSGTGVAVSANSDTVTVTAATEAYISMSSVSDTVVFGNKNKNTYGTYNIYDSEGKLKNTLVIDTGGGTGKNEVRAAGTNTEIFALTLSEANAKVLDTISSADDNKLTVNGVTYKNAGDAAVNYSVTNNYSGTKDELSITAGILGIESTDVSLITDTDIVFAEQSGIGLEFGSFTYKTTSNPSVATTFKISEASETQKASVTSGKDGIDMSVASGTKFFFNNELYTAASEKAGVHLPQSGSDTLLAGTSATGTTSAEKDYTVAVLSDTYTMSSGAGVTLVYTDEAAYSDTYAKTTFTSGSGTFKGTAGTFHIADNYLGGTSTDTTIYTYTKTSDTSNLNTMTLSIADGSETIALGAVKATRTADSTTTTFSFAPYDKENVFTYNVLTGSTDTALTFQLDSETAKTYGAVGVLTEGTGYRALDGTANSSTKVEYLGNEYLAETGATMTVKIEASAGTETFTAGTGTFTAESGTTFYYDFLDANGNIGTDGKVETLTAVEQVTMQATFDKGSGTQIVSISGKASIDTTGTYVLEALNQTYTMDESTWTVDLNGGVGSETMTLSSGTGKAEDLTSFALSDQYLGFGAKSADTYTYTGSATLSLNYAGEDSQTVTIESGSGTRVNESATGVAFDYTLNNTSHTYTSTAATLSYEISKDIAATVGATGSVFAGEGTRDFEAADSGTTGLGSVEYNSDTYTVDGGTIKLTLENGDGSETLIAANATFETSNTGVFHYVYGDETNTYTATADVKFTLAQDDSGTKLTSAAGAGVRDLTGAQTATSEYLSNVYNFGSGTTVQIDITGVDSATETAHAGKGTLQAEGTVYADFDANGSATGTVYSYTSFADATTFEITLESGTVKTQTLTAGSATRSSEGEDFTFEGKEYTAKGTTADAESMTFVLDTTNVSKGAAGEIFSGVGYRVDSGTQQYTVSETQNAYTAISGAEMKLTLTEGDGSETLLNATAEQGFDTFKYKGTTYQSSNTAVVGLKLEVVDGVASETGISGTGIFEATAGTETFTYESNEYTATSGTQLSITFDGTTDATPEFVSGSGHRSLANGEEFTYTDKNVYAVTENGELSVSKEEGAESATTTFSAGKGELDATKTNNQFYFTLESETHLYDNTGDAKVVITGSETGAVVTFEGGSAERTDTTTNLEFTFEGNTYNLTTDSALTLTLGLDESGTAVEKATGGKGTRTATSEFIYKSPISQQTETYTTTNAVLQVELDGENGTETFVSGTGTRNLESGTFTYAAAELGGQDAEFSGKATYELGLKATENAEDGMLSLMGYNVDVVTETLKQAAGTTTVTNPTYTSLRTNASATYTGDVTFGLNVENGSETVTWESGSATMQVASGEIFNYQLEGAEVTTYTVKADATFTRTSQTEEILTDGSGERAATADDKFTVEFNSDTYNAAASSTILLSAQDDGSGTKVVGETFDAGSATFTAEVDDKFHYTVGDATREYVAKEQTTLQVGVENGSATSIISATGAGTRGFEESETTVYDVLGDSYEVNSGTFTLTLDSGTYAAPSETLTQGAGVFTAAEGNEFHVNNAVLGISDSDSQTYAYNALSETKLNLTLEDGTASVEIESGFGTRSDNADTFTFKGNAYTAQGEQVYAIETNATAASGELYSAVGKRDAGEDATGTTVFNEDTYTVDQGVLTLTVEDGIGEEKMTDGTATYKAASGSEFHYSLTNDTNTKVYTAVEATTLQISVTDETNTQLISVSGQGTRAADEVDVSNTTLTYDYLGDKYNATTGTKVLFTAQGEPETAEESIYGSDGVVAREVTAGEQFNRVVKDEYDEDVRRTYTAGSNTTISLALSPDSTVQNFEADPNATRTSYDDTEFTLTDTNKTYTTYDGITYMLNGTGESSKLTEKLYAAQGTRDVAAGSDTYVSTLGNTYTLESGEYNITVTGGTGVETLISGRGTDTLTTGTFNYEAGTEYDEETGDDIQLTTTYKAQSAVLTVNHDEDGDTEVLVAGAGYDSGNGRYILATNSTLNAEDTAGKAPVSVSGSGVVTLAADAESGITSLSSGELNATVTADNTLKVNGKTYSGASGEGVVTFNAALNSATAGTGTVKAEGDFTGESNPVLAGGSVGIAEDTDVAVVFTADSITTLEKLSDKVTVTSAAGATRAITDDNGEFNFANAASQTFVVESDQEVTFQLDSDGVVTGIASLDKDAAVTITDSASETKITISDVGQVLTRGEDGSWTETAVEATAYIIEVASDSTITYSAVDVHGDKTKVNDSVVGSADGTTITLNNGLTATTPVIVTNASTDTVNLPGYVEGIGLTNGAAVQIDSDTTTNGAFKTGTLSGTNFTLSENYTVTGAAIEVTSSGEIFVNSQGDAKVAVSDTGKVLLVADTNTDKFTINDGPEMTLAIGAADADGVGSYTLIGDATITGLTPGGVETGTVVIPTDADGTSFAIALESVTVSGDGDGMTLEIKSDRLVGLSDIDTNATVAASVLDDTLSVNGDEVALTSDPIKYNATNEKWLSGPAPAAEGVIGYLIQVNADNTVSLSYQTSDTIKATTNVADYKEVFVEDSYAPDEDGGELKPYTGGVIEVNGTLGSDISVSVAAENGAVAVAVTNSEGKEIVLTTSEANYNVNGQEIIPSGEVKVLAQGETAQVTLNGATTVEHGEMTFDATTDSVVLFTTETIYLNDTAHVTNTNSEQVFNVNGTVSFDSAVVVADITTGGKTISNVRTTSASLTSGMTVDEQELNITGGDLAYTLNVAGSETVISGISGSATVSGELSNNAQILTDSTGTYQVGTATPFTISGDSAVAFKTTEGAVTAIESLEGTATGDFNGVSVDGKSVVILNDIDSVQAVTANGEKVTEITGVGNANTDVVVANAGGATLISTDNNGGIYFGAPGSTVSSKHYTVNDADSVVSFLTSELEDYTPSVSGVQGLAEGSIAISQNENNFGVNDAKVTLTEVGSDVTLNVADSAIVSVSGLTGGISGIESGVAVEITDGNVTVNGAEIAIYEPNGTNVIYTSTTSDTVTTNVITGLNKDAVVSTAANMNILTDEAGEFTFNNGKYTISGDDNVTFETDNRSNVKNVADVVGTVQSSARNNTINGAAVSSNDTDVTIVAAGSGISAVLGAKDGDSINVPEGTAVEMDMDGNSDTAAITVNGKTFEVTGDTDTVAFTAGSPDSISGLAPGASLRAVNTAGNYNVNGSDVYASVGAVIIGDEEGTAHVYDPSDVNISADDTPEQVIEKVTGGASTEDKYVEAMDSDTAQAALTQGGSALDGNLEMTLGGGTGTTSGDSVETADFSNSKGIKKVTMNGDGNQDVKFNDEGGNIAVLGNDAEGEKNISLGNGGDLAVVGKTGATTPVNITAGRGRDSVVSQGRNVKVNVGAGGPTRLMANGYGASMEVEGYDANNGAGIQLTNSDIKAAVKKNTVALENGKVTTSEGAEIRTAAEEPTGSSVVNFYNLKGLMTKVGYTYNEGGTVDLSSSKNDVVMKGNYTEGNAQRKSGSSKLISGSGDDYALGGAGDDIDVGEGNNTVELDGTTRTNADAGAVISQTATRGRTEVNGFHNDFGDTGDRVNVSTSANVKFVNGVLTFLYGAAQLILNGMAASSASSSDLAESADEDDNATAVTGTTDYARVMIGDANAAVKTAVASEGNWIGGGDSLWSEDNMPSAYVGENSGISFNGSDGALNITLGSGSEGNGAGTLGSDAISVRGISKLRLGSGSSTVYGAADTNNTIVTGLGESSVWGGGSSNDTFIGRQTSLKSGESTFFYVDGDGKDTISNFEFLASDNVNTADVVNVLGTSVTGAATSGNDVIINLFNSDDDRLTIKDAAGKDFVMEYGNVGSFDTLVAQVNNSGLTYDGRASYYQATGRNATLTADSGLDSAEIWLNNNRDFVQKTTFVGDISVLNASAVQGKSTLVGNGYNNMIVGSSENSSMWGGDSHEANDTLVGGAGADMFWYGKNEGNDVITGVDENDVINLYNVNIADVESYDTWNITNNSISFNLKDGGSLTVQSNNSGVGFKFADDDNVYAVDQRTKEHYTK